MLIYCVVKYFVYFSLFHKKTNCILSRKKFAQFAYIYSTDHKQLNARSRLTREGGAGARERSMQHSRVAYEYSRVVYECVHASASRRVCNTCNSRVRMSERSTSAREQSTRAREYAMCTCENFVSMRK